MANNQSYNITAKGFIEITGNTLGLAGSSTVLVGGIRNFTIATPNPPDGGTTQSINSNSSSAFLNLPINYQILYAELFWGGIYQDNTTGLDVTSQIDNNINLTDPRGITTSIAVTPNTSQQNIPYGYVRSADVTNIISVAGAGKYTVSGVAAILTGNFTVGNVDNYFAGWSLYVIVEDLSQSHKNMTIWNSFDTPGTFVNISGFSTPATGSVAGRLFISAGSGNANLTGDQLRFGPTAGTVTALSTPTNLVSNFFVGVICDRYGNVNTTGTWGNVNDTANVTPVQGNRSMYDLTGVDVSSTLQNNQTSAVININSTGDGIISNALALEIEVNAANLYPIVKTVDKQYTDIGETLTYTIAFSNSGLVSALNVILIDTIPAQTKFISNSVSIDNVNQPGLSPQLPGLNLGNIEPNQRMTVTFNVLVITTPQGFPLINTIPNVASVGYSFVSVPGTPTIPANDISSTATTILQRANLEANKIVDKNYANVGAILTYTIPIKNMGDVTAHNIIFTDTIPSGTSIINDSFKQDGNIIVSNTGIYNVTLPNNIGSLSVSTITFQVKIDTIPNPNPIINSASMQYSYTVDGSTIPIRVGNNSTNTNSVSTKINNANLSNIVKYVDKEYATCGDFINYTIVLNNNGNVTAQRVVIKDTIPNNTQFIANSIYIDGVQQSGGNPTIGISVPDIGPISTKTISFSVVVQC